MGILSLVEGRADTNEDPAPRQKHATKRWVVLGRNVQHLDVVVEDCKIVVEHELNPSDDWMPNAVLVFTEGISRFI